MRALRLEILEKAEDIMALETVIETEGFHIDQEDRDKFANLRNRINSRKLNAAIENQEAPEAGEAEVNP